MLSTVANWLFGCSHRQTSFPFTCRVKGRVGLRESHKTQTYVVCLDCGTRIPYDWSEMRMERRPIKTVPPAGNRWFDRLVHHT